MGKSRTKIGLEIEVNNLNRNLRDSIDWNIWSRDNEHCGVELRTKPISGRKELSRLSANLKQMEKSPGAKACGFNNAGTHLHIDFISDAVENTSKLSRKAAPKVNDIYVNPTGSLKRWYWIDETGRMFEKPSDAQAPMNAHRANMQTPATQLENVKRFLTIGVRFSDVMICLQHPDRRLNKYCHAIGAWDETLLNSRTSVYNIANDMNLQQGHRRHAINAMAFAKWGTIEIRLIKASLTRDEIWAQIVMFCKLANKAKGREPLPVATGMISIDFVTLLNWAGLTGKHRKTLTDMFRRNTSIESFNSICYSCQGSYDQRLIVDYGLSRPVCMGCDTNMNVCCHCGEHPGYDGRPSLLDNRNGRKICGYCSEMKQDILKQEKAGNFIYLMSLPVGSGFDSVGPTQLRRMRGLLRPY